MKRIFIVTALFITITALFNTQSKAQCLNDDHYFEHQFHNDPAGHQRMLEAMELWQHHQDDPVVSGKKNVFRVPVVFHIIHEYGPENISREQILDQLRTMNEDFRRLNSDASKTRSIFRSIAADSEVEFFLARKDPQGNCTEGIVRVFSPLTNNARDNVKAVSYWPSDRYLNVWVVNTIQTSSDEPGVITLGYAQFPWDRSSKPTTDGIVLRADYTGSIGTAANKNNAGRTATHELGHYFGLFHTFQGGCFPPSWGEQIQDTPPVRVSSSGCPLGANSCTNDNPDLPDQVENYMDYSNGTCQNMFTNGQKSLMLTMINAYRSTLVSSQNHINTGIDLTSSVCAPKADFSPVKSIICEGASVTFSDLSYNGPVTSRTWTFQGGTPATSNAANPTVVYNQAGTYRVTLVVGNSAGNSQIIRDSLITVFPAVSKYYGLMNQSFQEQPFPPVDWKTVSSNTALKWEVFQGAGSHGDRSARAVIGASTPDGIIAELITMPLDMQAVSEPVLTFDLAYAKRTTTSLDRLRVYVSVDCGVSWVLVYQRAGVQMETGVTGTTNFVPTSSQWAPNTISLKNYAGRRNLLIRFDAVSNQGGNIYIDNINVTSATSLPDPINNSTVKLYPNPANTQATLEFECLESGVLTVRILDLFGREVRRYSGIAVESGMQSHELSISGFAAGGYFVEAELNGQRIRSKLLVTQ